jgi:hypothetical protein
VGTGGVFRNVRLAQDDGASSTHSLYVKSIMIRHILRVADGAVSRAKPCGVVCIFHSHRGAKRGEVRARSKIVKFLSTSEGALSVDRHDRVDIDGAGQLSQIGTDDFDRRDIASAQRGAKLHRGQID